MTLKWLIPTLFLTACLTGSAYSQNMDNQALGEILTEMSDSIVGDNGRWQMEVRGAMMICITDETHNRMRIITPVKRVEDMSKREMMACMEANFHTALDVKYAVSDGILWVVFIHPLKELSEEQARDAVKQVYYGLATYGTTYSSTDLTFPEPDGKRN